MAARTSTEGRAPQEASAPPARTQSYSPDATLAAAAQVYSTAYAAARAAGDSRTEAETAAREALKGFITLS